MRRLALDLRSLLRSWRRDKLAVAAAVLALALGFGAGGVALTLVERIALTPAPYDRPDQLVFVESVHPEAASEGRVSMADYLDWREQSQVFSHLAVFREYSFTLLAPGVEPEELHATLASPALFQVLRRQAVLGRSFLAEEEIPGNDAVVLLSHGLWQRRFEGDAGVLGRTLDLGGQPHRVVGVMPASFEFPDHATELWSPLAFDRQTRDGLRRDRRVMRAIGRLAEGMTAEQARGAMARLATALAAEHPASNAGWSVRLVPLAERRLAPYRALLALLSAAAAAVLLIAALDVVHLLLARADERRLDLAIRRTLGAGPLEALRFALLEGAVLALVATGPALLLARTGLGALAALSPPELSRFRAADLGFGLVLVMVAGGLFCGLLVGLLAAFEDWRRRGDGENTHRRAVVGSRGVWGGALITSEVAASLMLLIAAGLLGRSYARLEAVDPGFETEGVMTIQIFLPQARYPGPPQRAAFYRRLLEELDAVPGLDHAALVSAFPLNPVGIELLAPARAERAMRPTTAGSLDPGRLPQVPVRIASPGYFRGLSIPLVDGRPFGDRDHFGAPPVAVVNAELARQLWPAGQAVGQRLVLELARPRTVEVVGVVGNLRYDRLSMAPGPEVYLPVEQFPLPGKTLVLRSALGQDRALEIAKSALWAVDDQQPIYAAATADELVHRALGEHRLGRLGVALLAGLALVLTLVGLYAMAAQGIARRTTEIGVRLALGARPPALLAALLRPLFRATSAGLGLGLVAAVALGGLLDSLLYGISRADLSTYATATLFLALVTLLGGLLPAWRALGLEPMAALRQR